MPSRIPLDVDLEDRLLYGLTPTRLVYILIALVAAFSTWSAHWTLAPVRGICAVLLVVLGAVAAWGAWRNRPADAWAGDVVMFCLATYRIRCQMPHGLRRLLRRT